MVSGKKSSKLMIDESSGEVYELSQLRAPRRAGSAKSPQKKGAGFVLLYPDGLLRAGLSGAQVEVLVALAEQMDRDTGVVKYAIDELCQRLRISAAESIYRSIRQLEQRGALLRMPGRRSTLLINPEVVWRGSQEFREVAIFTWTNATREEATA